MLKKQILWTFVVLLAIAAALSGRLDAASESQAEDALKNALVQGGLDLQTRGTSADATGGRARGALSSTRLGERRAASGPDVRDRLGPRRGASAAAAEPSNPASHGGGAAS